MPDLLNSLLARAVLVGSVVALWCCTPVLAQAAETRLVASDAIMVPLSIYITSIITTAGATWFVARYDAARSAEIRELRDAVKRLAKDKE